MSSGKRYNPRYCSTSGKIPVLQIGIFPSYSSMNPRTSQDFKPSDVGFPRNPRNRVYENLPTCYNNEVRT